MRRSVATIVGTLAGTALLIGAKFGTHPVDATAAADPLAAADPASGAADAQQPVTKAPPTTAPGTTAATRPPASTAARPAGTTPGQRPPAASGLKNGTFTGAGSSERYGTITVTITVSGGRLTGASATCSGCNSTSRSISGGAFPTLRQEALTAQNARIATVSGATYTSSAYRISLQSALDAAKA